ncbi:LEAF RUST 10 DISEASE-RESISTANCE LOCUS RECEPTOR-LIKE PROTEIN KINASE-like 2.5 [Humulus lupulus]|uniref:LEAF RUST 10 DISEASE-RESISTANCE LOCUS RECEPTOR-LIKE PROTEIN KINASE-like 2.5 n=1 Tax=Humulus lupulus TaxID=3486 RepID=UPI002B405E7C|nr:LEAF RUST 10 DISEASE-RESISTANCE LOCUS RECEPTOR-LIKE PROTEIN KINASE-like 2.5 [Humulus lupulus]
MYPLLHASSLIFFTIVTVSVGVPTPFKTVEDEAKFEACRHRFKCGNASFGYPYWGGERNQDCGHPDFKLECHHNTYPEIEIVSRNPEIEIVSRKFYILGIRERDETITVVDAHMVDDGCPDRVVNISVEAFENGPFKCASNNARLTYVYNCSTGIPNTTSPELRCTSKAEPGYHGYYLKDPSGYEKLPCNGPINIPLLQKYYTDLLTHRLTAKDALSKGFDLEYEYGQEACWECLEYSGQCGFNTTSEEFVCFSKSSNSGPKKKMLKLVLELGLGSPSGIGIIVIVVLIVRRLWKKHQTYGNVEAFLENYGPLQVRRYSYSDVKKMTNSFKEKLGQGGFGCVYKGKLHDEHLVAVKMLNESKENNGEEFINEVAAISRTSHVNVVTLLGFCFEGAKKALIYEFMPNGSLEKFVYDENETEESYQLDWETYYQISLGTARGLEYLHRGCNLRILHFDIKPHNILLDADFVPKISDFGLAKICTKKDSLVSMLGPRGTIGYIAPEVFCRSFGGVFHKSDVYSYGMMVLEMVGGRKNVNVRVDNSSEIYFPQWIYKRLEIEELGLKRIMNEEDNVKARKMIMTSLWCVQNDPSSRPTMSRVIEMLEGSLDSLEVPPKPFLSSPPRTPLSDSSNTFISFKV